MVDNIISDRPLKWVAMASIGSFVARDARTGAIIARPMNADGSMSQYPEEECEVDITAPDYAQIAAVLS